MCDSSLRPLNNLRKVSENWGNLTTHPLQTPFANLVLLRRRLRLANAGMKTIGAKAIAAALCANHILETIDLSGNNFGCNVDDNAWESAPEMLSFGLQARYAV